MLGKVDNVFKGIQGNGDRETQVLGGVQTILDDTPSLIHRRGAEDRDHTVLKGQSMIEERRNCRNIEMNS